MEFLIITLAWFTAALLVALALNGLFTLLFKSKKIYKFIEKIF